MNAQNLDIPTYIRRAGKRQLSVWVDESLVSRIQELRYWVGQRLVEPTTDEIVNAALDEYLAAHGVAGAEIEPDEAE
jgi:hypothetical protein